MKLLANTGTERVVDELRATLVAGSTLDIATPALSVFAFGELRDLLNQLKNCRLVLPPPSANGLGLLGAEADRPYRNRLQTRWLATELATWLEAAAEVRAARGAIPQSALIARSEPSESRSAVTGTCSFTTPGLGIAPSSDLSLVQITDGADEADRLSQWFEALWSSIPAADDAKRTLLDQVGVLSANRSPAFIYFLALHHLFPDSANLLPLRRVTGSDLRRWGLHYAESGARNAKKRAVVVVARRLAVLMLAPWKSGELLDVGRRRGAVPLTLTRPLS